jgi:hypothetical protein
VLGLIGEDGLEDDEPSRGRERPPARPSPGYRVERINDHGRPSERCGCHLAGDDVPDRSDRRLCQAASHDCCLDRIDAQERCAEFPAGTSRPRVVLPVPGRPASTSTG